MNPAAREARLLEIGRGIVRAPGPDEAEVLLTEGREVLTRFARSQIHQNVGTEEVWAVVRVAWRKRVGVSTASSLEAAALEEAAASALAIARASEPRPDWPGLPRPRPVPHVEAYDEATAEASADLRADLAREIIEAARRRKAEAAGAVEVTEGSLAVVNSRGVEAAMSHTHARVHTVVTCEDGSGYAEGVAMRVGDLDAGRMGQRAATKAAASRRPRPLPPGRYDVVLEPAATAEWLAMLGYLAFSGKAFDEGRSPLSGRLGQAVTGPDVTILDHARDRRTLPMAFDYEGQPKRRLSLLDRGVAKAVATNFYRARRLGKRRSSGSALPASSGYECMPLHLFMRGGASSLRHLIQDTRRGLLVTRFHYTNVLDPLKTALTGMTRDGTFLIEGGEIVGPVRNLRYTENVLEALARIDGLSRRVTLVRGPCVVPAARIREVQFTGATAF